MAGHGYFLLASVFPDENVRGEELAALVRTRQWQQAATFQDWKSDRDEREYYLIRCPSRGGLLLFTVLSLWEMRSDDFVESCESLDADSSATLVQIVGDRWQLF